jgi:Vanillate O-demethylase oxygenase C-terminal domain
VVEDTEWGFKAKMSVKVNRLSGINRFIFDQNDPDAYKVYMFSLPNLTYTAIHFGKLQLESLLASVPINDNETVVKAVNIRNFLNDVPLVSNYLDYHVAQVGNKILFEDDIIVRQQSPVAVPYENSRQELLVGSDATMMAYRKLLRKYAQPGQFPDAIERAFQSSVAD